MKFKPDNFPGDLLRVYRHTPSGALFLRRDGGFRTTVDANQTWQVTLTPAYDVVHVITREPLAPQRYPEMLVLAEDTHAHHLAVSEEAFEKDFEFAAEFGAKLNTPIDTLLAHYESECCDFSDLDGVVKLSRHYVDRISDGQVRCLLHALAEHVAANLLPSNKKIGNMPDTENAETKTSCTLNNPGVKL